MGNANIKQSYRCISRSTCKKHIRSETNLADRTTITALSLIHTWNKPLTAKWTLLLLLFLITGSIARSTTRRYLIYSEADFEVFRPATRCTDWGEIWHGGGSSWGAPKLKFLLRFDQNVKYKCPAGVYPLCDFHKIFRVCTAFQYALAVKISLDLLKGLWNYGGFKLTGYGYPQIFSAP